jgi:hypothetical protein
MDTTTWLNGTKAANKRGRPSVVYHGTLSDIQEFREEKAGAGFLGLGFYFTDNRLDASSNYANGPKFTKLTGIGLDHFDNSGVVMPCFLSMKNPLIAGGKETTRFFLEDGSLKSFIEAFRKASSAFPGVPSSGVKYMADERFLLEAGKTKTKSLTMEEIVGLVRRQIGLNASLFNGDIRLKMEMLQHAFSIMGFDGVIYDDAKRRSGAKMENITKDTRHFVVFKADQIRPALGHELYIESAREQALVRSRTEVGSRQDADQDKEVQALEQSRQAERGG